MDDRKEKASGEKPLPYILKPRLKDEQEEESRVPDTVPS